MGAEFVIKQKQKFMQLARERVSVEKQVMRSTLICSWEQSTHD